MAATIAGTSLLSRLKSINLRFLLCLPPRPFAVTLPSDLPEDLGRGASKVFSGLDLVITLFSRIVLNLCPGVTGLKTLRDIYFLQRNTKVFPWYSFSFNRQI